MSHISISHRLDPMWDGSSAPELKQPVLEDGPWPEPGQHGRPLEQQQMFCGYCGKLFVPPGQPNRIHACEGTVRQMYLPGTVVKLDDEKWALVLETTDIGSVVYQEITTFTEVQISDFHELITGDKVTT